MRQESIQFLAPSVCNSVVFGMENSLSSTMVMYGLEYHGRHRTNIGYSGIFVDSTEGWFCAESVRVDRKGLDASPGYETSVQYLVVLHSPPFVHPIRGIFY